jgi:hypothetical protein
MASSSSSQCASCWPEPGLPVPALSAVVSLRLCAEYAMPTPRATLTGRELGRLRGGARPAMLGGSLYVGQRGGDLDRTAATRLQGLLHGAMDGAGDGLFGASSRRLLALPQPVPRYLRRPTSALSHACSISARRARQVSRRQALALARSLARPAARSALAKATWAPRAP